MPNWSPAEQRQPAGGNGYTHDLPPQGPRLASARGNRVAGTFFLEDPRRLTLDLALRARKAGHARIAVQLPQSPARGCGHSQTVSLDR